MRAQRVADSAEHALALALDRLRVERSARVPQSDHPDAQGVLGEGIPLRAIHVLLELVDDLGIGDAQGEANGGCILVGRLRGDVGDCFHGSLLLGPSEGRKEQRGPSPSPIWRRS